MKITWICALFLGLAGCTQKIERPGPGITFHNGDLLYHGKKYSGIVVERFPAIGTVRESRYRGGQPDGEQNEFFESTRLKVAHREFAAGNVPGTKLCFQVRNKQ